jgi:Flp pilus assembly protein TadG
MSVRRRRSLFSSLAPIGRTLTRFLRGADGTAAIEFAIVANALLLFLLGVVEFGRLYWTQSELQYAAEATARYATIYTVNNPSATLAQVQTAAQTQAPTYAYSMSVPASDFAVTAYNATATPPAPSCGNQVIVTYPFSFIVTGLFPWSITLTAQGCHQG